MQLDLSGHHVEITESMRNYVVRKFERIARHFDQVIDVHCVLTVEKQRHKAEADVLEYDIMQAPHHCSWHSLSYDSWSDYREKAKLDADARKALSQTRNGAVIVASCKPIADDDSDPPCIRAKREYVAIVDEVKGDFYCTGEYPSEKSVEPLVFTVTAQGVQPPSKKEAGSKAAAVITSARAPMPHGAS